MSRAYGIQLEQQRKFNRVVSKANQNGLTLNPEMEWAFDTTSTGLIPRRLRRSHPFVLILRCLRRSCSFLAFKQGFRLISQSVQPLGQFLAFGSQVGLVQSARKFVWFSEDQQDPGIGERYPIKVPGIENDH
jgi:hypothetical protein